MISLQALNQRAQAKVRDAEVLFDNNRYHGAVYISGYALELALKYRICKTLNWSEFPESNNEFKSRKDLKTHNLNDLLMYSGMEKRIKRTYLSDWSNANQWNPEIRYGAIGKFTKSDARTIMEATRRLINTII